MNSIRDSVDSSGGILCRCTGNISCTEVYKYRRVGLSFFFFFLDIRDYGDERSVGQIGRRGSVRLPKREQPLGEPDASVSRLRADQGVEFVRGQVEGRLPDRAERLSPRFRIGQIVHRPFRRI